IKESRMRKNIEEQIKQIKLAQAVEKIKILDRACISYQSHLAALIKEELESMDPKFATNLMVSWPIGISTSEWMASKLILRNGLDIAADQIFMAVNNSKPVVLTFGNQYKFISEPCK